MRGPAYSIPSVDRRTGMGTYEPDVSQMPPAPAGYQYQVVTGQLFPQLVAIPNPVMPLEGILILGAAALIAWMAIGGKKTISLPSMP
jgi:hypothetical protein